MDILTIKYQPLYKYTTHLYTYTQHINHTNTTNHTCFSNSCFPLHCVCSQHRSRPPQVASWPQRTSCCLRYGHQPDPCCRKATTHPLLISLNNAPPTSPHTPKNKILINIRCGNHIHSDKNMLVDNIFGLAHRLFWAL